MDLELLLCTLVYFGALEARRANRVPWRYAGRGHPLEMQLAKMRQSLEILTLS